MRIAGRNRAPAIGGDEIDLQIVGELSQEDIADLGEARPAFTGPPTVQRLRDTHHSLARALAAGLNYIQAGAKTGYTATRVSMLMADPAFQELVSAYRATVNEEFREEAAAIAENTFAVVALAARMKRDKLEEADEAGELPSHGELDQTIRVFGEFTGLSAAKRTINHNVNANLGDLLAAARARAFNVAPVSLVPSSRSDLPASSSSFGTPTSAPEPDEPDGT